VLLHGRCDDDGRSSLAHEPEFAVAVNHRRVREEGASASAVVPAREISFAISPNFIRADKRLLQLPQ
jgi:hypothetical protein